jgi:hypothetical protein
MKYLGLSGNRSRNQDTRQNKSKRKSRNIIPALYVYGISSVLILYLDSPIKLPAARTDICNPLADQMFL